MIKNIILILWLLPSLHAFAQKWKKVDQSWMNVTYSLPAHWETDGFGSDGNNFDGTGSSVCECAGSINFGDDRSIGMVIYPFNKNSDASRRMAVWDFRFKEVPNKSNFAAKAMSFEESLSVWEGEGDENMKQAVVKRYISKRKGVNVIIYFWGQAEMMKANETSIKKILQSIAIKD